MSNPHRPGCSCRDCALATYAKQQLASTWMPREPVEPKPEPAEPEPEPVK